MGKTANIEHFCSFYEKIVETQNDAVYIRNRLDELEGNKKEKAKSPKALRKHMLATKVKAKDKSARDNSSSNVPFSDRKSGGSPANKYCIFCEAKGHWANWCKN